MKRMFHNSRYANVAATLALVFAMGGTSYAAYSLPHNSVGASQIRTNAVKSSEIDWSSVTTGKVRDGTLRAQDFAGGQLPAGPQGPQGPQGPAGGATAYAKVAPGGGVTQSQGFAGGAVAYAGGGIYCVSGLPFHPRSAMVTADTANTSVPVVASVDAPGMGLAPSGCSTGAQASVKVVNSTNSNATPAGFFIWLEK
jgi:hypothetical protein